MVWMQVRECNGCTQIDWTPSAQTNRTSLGQCALAHINIIVMVLLTVDCCSMDPRESNLQDGVCDKKKRIEGESCLKYTNYMHIAYCIWKWTKNRHLTTLICITTPASAIDICKSPCRHIHTQWRSYLLLLSYASSHQVCVYVCYA